MCGRYSFAQLSEEVEKRFKIKVDGNTYIARYNCAPGQKLGIITNRAPQKLSFFQWGLIPSWASTRNSIRPIINARGESLKDKPSFVKAFESKRCLIPADGFYEWKKNGKQLVPHYIRFKTKETFAFAGLWEEWNNPKHETIHTFTIITTKANNFLQNLHARMPLILPRSLEQEWLQNNNMADLEKMIQAFDDSKLEAFEISQQINKTDIDTADLIKPFNNKVQLSLFDSEDEHL